MWLRMPDFISSTAPGVISGFIAGYVSALIILRIYKNFNLIIDVFSKSKKLVNDFNKGCDDIVKDKELTKSSDHSHALVGQVEQELLIPKDILNKWGKWFGIQVRLYVAGYFNQFTIPEQNIFGSSKEQASQIINKTQTNVKSAWYIRSFAGDYNPMHTHTDCELTCVGFLKVPDLSKEHKKRHANFNGVLEILNNSGPNEKAFFENDSIGFSPKVGNWYLFPANIRHGVYPFSCDGERRSFSINMNTSIFKGVTDQ